MFKMTYHAKVSCWTERSEVKYLITRRMRDFSLRSKWHGPLFVILNGTQWSEVSHSENWEIFRYAQNDTVRCLSYWTEHSEVKYLITRIERFFTSFKMTRSAVCHTERNAVKWSISFRELRDFSLRSKWHIPRNLSYWTERSEVKYLITRRMRDFSLHSKWHGTLFVILNGTQWSEVSHSENWEIFRYAQNDTVRCLSYWT